MMRSFLALVFSLALVWTAPVAAQETAWVQIEAQPTLGEAQARVRAYAARLDDVAGFYLGSGWYGIALGPYARGDAEALLRRLRAAGEIPGDSYITSGSGYESQFWPIGVGIDRNPQPLPEAPGITVPQLPETITAPQPVPVAPPALPEESRSTALAAEQALTRGERERLQTVLEWAGFYQGAIDGAFGRGTRAAMEGWQTAHGHAPTGVLTTAQRAALIADYDAVLSELGLQLVRDDAAGVEMLLPMGVVAFDRHAPPFALYAGKGGIAPQVILISQPGDSARLSGLYEILQTLEIMPPEGPRDRTARAFTMEGIDDRIHSFAQAEETGGEIKGFILVWPAEDEARRARLLAEMRASFRVLSGTLDAAITPPDEEQSVDLVSGLAIRTPRLVRSGFFITEGGTVLTTAEAVAECREITLAGSHPARVRLVDAASGVAVVEPAARLAPPAVAAFQTGVPRLQTQIAVAGFPYGAALSRPVLTFGHLADLRGLNGEEGLRRLDLNAQPGDAGGPVLDGSGAVLGLLLPQGAGDQILPPDVGFAVASTTILDLLAKAGINARTTDRSDNLPAATLGRAAADFSVFVSCW